MIKLIDEDGTEYEVVSMRRPMVGQIYLMYGKEGQVCVSTKPCNVNERRPILKRIIKKITTPEQARKWAEAKPELIVRLRGDLYFAKELIFTSESMPKYLIQTEFDAWTPITEIDEV